MPDQEQARLRRLRERQIADRDPLVKQRKIQREISTKTKRMRKPFKLSGAWKDFPHVIRTPIYGLLLGVIVFFALPKFWASPNAAWVAIIVTVLLVLFGFILGGSLDWRDSLKNDLR